MSVTGRPTFPWHRYVVFVVLALGGLGIDLWSKHAVFRDLGYPGPPQATLASGEHRVLPAPAGVEGVTIPWIDGWLTFRLYTSFNRGALWGIGQGYTLVFALLSVVAVATVIYWLFVCGNASSAWITVSLSLIMGGALGNLYDRVGLHQVLEADGTRMYAVRDFFLFTFGTFAWPVFNFADVFLVTGAIMLGLHVLLTPATETRPAEATTKPAEVSPDPGATQALAGTVALVQGSASRA